jgi:hypothetical protein
MVFFALLRPVLSALSTIALLSLSMRWRRRSTGRLVANPIGLFIEGASVVRRNQILAGFFKQRGERPVIRLKVRRHPLFPVDIEVASEDDGEALLRALRVDAASAPARFPIQLGGIRRVQWFLTAMCIPLALVCGGVMTLGARHVFPFALAAPIAGLCIAAILFAALWMTNTLLVGSDGLLVQNALRYKRFTPFRDVRDVSSEGGDVVVHLHSGKALRLGVGGTSGRVGRALYGSTLEEAPAICARIKEGLDRFHAQKDGAEIASLLARGRRDVKTWMRELGGVSDDVASFRTAAVPDDQLWRVLEDARTEPNVRLGAALALRPRLNAEGLARLRVASETCMQPKLRVAFEALDGGGEEEELERALSGVDDA